MPVFGRPHVGNPSIRFYLYDHGSGGFHRLHDGTVCGRGDADIDLGDDTLSRRHCLITVDGNDVYVEDLGSRNGTRVNGVPLEKGHRRRFQLGDLLELGNRRLVLTHQNTHVPGHTQARETKRELHAIARRDGELTTTIPAESSSTHILLDRKRYRALRAREILFSSSPHHRRSRRFLLAIVLFSIAAAAWFFRTRY